MLRGVKNFIGLIDNTFKVSKVVPPVVDRSVGLILDHLSLLRTHTKSVLIEDNDQGLYHFTIESP